MHFQNDTSEKYFPVCKSHPRIECSQQTLKKKICYIFIHLLSSSQTRSVYVCVCVHVSIKRKGLTISYVISGHTVMTLLLHCICWIYTCNINISLSHSAFTQLQIISFLFLCYICLDLYILLWMMSNFHTCLCYF